MTFVISRESTYIIASKTLSARKNIQLSKIDRSEDRLSRLFRAGASSRNAFNVTSNVHRVTTWRENKELDLVELDGIEPTTSGLQSPRSPS